MQAHVDAGVYKPVIEVSEAEGERRLALEVIREFSNNKNIVFLQLIVENHISGFLSNHYRRRIRCATN
mgnify:CR=1 FL=1|jgi:hypothetical protein